MQIEINKLKKVSHIHVLKTVTDLKRQLWITIRDLATRKNKFVYKVKLRTFEVMLPSTQE